MDWMHKETHQSIIRVQAELLVRLNQFGLGGTPDVLSI
jgi:hypothetical protein